MDFSLFKSYPMKFPISWNPLINCFNKQLAHGTEKHKSRIAGDKVQDFNFGLELHQNHSWKDNIDFQLRNFLRYQFCICKIQMTPIDNFIQSETLPQYVHVNTLFSSFHLTFPNSNFWCFYSQQNVCVICFFLPYQIMNQKGKKKENIES